MKCPVCNEEADFTEEHNLVICMHCRSVLLGVPIQPNHERAFESLCERRGWIEGELPTEADRKEAAAMIAWLIYSLNKDEADGYHTWKGNFRGEVWRSHTFPGEAPFDYRVFPYLTETNRPFAQWVRHEVTA